MDTLTFYVATDGDDCWSGKLPAPNAQKTDGPFATLARAQSAIREVKAQQGLSKPVTVLIREGKYFLRETLVLHSQDSGTREYPISYKAYSGEKPVLSGGRMITGWTPYQGKILQTQLPSAKGGKWKFRQLFFNGKRQIWARYPNLDPENPIYEGWIFVAGPDTQDTFATFTYKPGTFKRHWEKPTEAEVYLLNPWGVTDVIPIKAIDEENHVITLTHSVRGFDRYPWYVPSVHGGPRASEYRFYVQNVLEELDQPGEWCLDSEEGILYFWPPESIEAAEVVVPVLDCLIDLRGASWITISGFTLTETTTGDNVHHEFLEGYGGTFPVGGREYCGDAVHLRNAQHCCIENNHFYAVGGNAVYLEDYNARNVIQNNEIGYAGAYGVCLIGCRYFHPVPHHPIYNQVTNNHIHHCGFFNKYIAGVFLGLSDGNLIDHNLIEQMPHHGINFGNSGFGRNIAEYNEIRHVCLETFDNGAINSWMEDPQDRTQREVERSGHIIRFNLIADIRGCTRDERDHLVPGGNTLGIYLDNFTSNCVAYGNIIVRCAGDGGIFLNSGKNNVVENNIIVECRRQLGTHGMWHSYAPQMAGFLAGNRFCRNIFYRSRSDGYMYYFGAWSDRALGQADYNLFFSADGGEHTVQLRPEPDLKVMSLSLAEWQGMGYDVHSVIADPLFVDPKHDDYRLKPDSPALKLGFVPIDVSKIGIRHQKP